MAYCVLADVKLELGLADDENADDDLLEQKIAAAQAFIEAYTGRVWEAPASDETREYTVGEDTDGRLLILDETLVAAPTTVVTNADGASPVTVPNTDYVLKPRNKAPYWGIELLGQSAYDWRYSRNPENGITVTGKFAYSVTPPADIVQACIRLAAFYYRMKDTNVYDVTASLETGQMVIPKGTPQDVVHTLKNRKKPGL